MSQPIRKLADEPNVRFGPEALNLYPELALHIARIAATWSMVENNISLAFIMLVGSGSETSIAMYKALTGTATKDHAMNAAAEDKLTAEDYLLYQATRKILKRTARQRNNVVHGLVGQCDQIKDALVIMHQDVLFDQMNDHLRKKHLSSDAEAVLRVAEERFASKACVYKDGDFKKVIERLNWAVSVSNDLAIICAEVHREHSRARSRLSSEPLIRKELTRLSQGQKTSQGEL